MSGNNDEACGDILCECIGTVENAQNPNPERRGNVSALIAVAEAHVDHDHTAERRS